MVHICCSYHSLPGLGGSCEDTWSSFRGAYNRGDWWAPACYHWTWLRNWGLLSFLLKDCLEACSNGRMTNTGRRSFNILPTFPLCCKVPANSPKLLGLHLITLSYFSLDFPLYMLYHKKCSMLLFASLILFPSLTIYWRNTCSGLSAHMELFVSSIIAVFDG